LGRETRAKTEAVAFDVSVSIVSMIDWEALV
jgi:hypothetical protein